MFEGNLHLIRANRLQPQKGCDNKPLPKSHASVARSKKKDHKESIEEQKATQVAEKSELFRVGAASLMPSLYKRQTNRN